MIQTSGQSTLTIAVMPEQLLRFQAWSDEVGVPLDRFMRKAAEMLCGQLAEHATEDHGEDTIDSPKMMLERALN